MSKFSSSMQEKGEDGEDEALRLAADGDLRSDWHQIGQLFDVMIVHADAAFGYVLPDGGFIVGAVYAVMRLGQPHPKNPIGSSWKRLLIDDVEFAARWLRRDAADTDGKGANHLVALEKVQPAVRQVDDYAVGRHSKSPFNVK